MVALYGPPGIFAGSDTIYKMTPEGAVTILYTFPISQDYLGNGAYNYTATNGALPIGLIQGADGNFYGTTATGGTGPCQPDGYYGVNGCGTVFKMTPAGTLTTLYSFTAAKDGSSPAAPLVRGTDGNFYGTTYQAGQMNYGTVFRITPAGVLTTLYAFNGTDGEATLPLTPAPSGSFYGITGSGGSGSYGTIFEITAAGNLTTLYTFCSQANCSDGEDPGAMVLATDGNLYGITYYADEAPASGGSIFKFSPPPQVVTPPANTPAITASNGVVSGASFQSGIANGSWITIKGTNLSTVTDSWNDAIVNGALPTTLDGVKVTVGGEPAYIAYISLTQINAVAPTISAGSMPVTVTNSNGTSPVAMAEVQAAQPAFFQWGNYAVATTLTYSYAVKNGTFPGTTTTAAQPGSVIVLWGTGFGPTTPPAPVGFEVPATTTYNTANPVTVTVGGMPATVYGAALTPGYAGLYQVAIQIPSLANGDYPIVATVPGAQSPSATLITVQQ